MSPYDMTMAQLRQTGLELQSRLDTERESNAALRARVAYLEPFVQEVGRQEAIAASYCDELYTAQRRVTELEAAREREHERFLMWRAIEGTPCKDCTGSGVKLYGSTSTWRGGAGGQTVTTAVCNKCWGSGSAEQPWPSWRSRP